jgi:hypothetical protein
MRLSLAIYGTRAEAMGVAAVAAAVASSRQEGPRASSSLRSGVAWQKAIAGMLGAVARLRAASLLNVGDRVNPPRARSAATTDGAN